MTSETTGGFLSTEPQTDHNQAYLLGMALFFTSLSAAQWLERSSGIWEVRFSIPVQDSIFCSIR